MKASIRLIFLALILSFGCELDELFQLDACACELDENYDTTSQYITENVVIVVIDGVRYSESGADDTGFYCPNIYGDLADNGVVLSNFYNNGLTKTVSGHTNLLTGKEEVLNNAGLDYPQCPSILQLWLKQTQSPPTKAWIVSGKHKLEVLSDCATLDWRTTFNPSMDAGVDGLGEDLRQDSETHARALEVLDEYRPNILVVLYPGPDVYAHANDWDAYVSAIQACDGYVQELWEYIESDEHYAGKTSLFVTNDHGRHNQGIKDGFISHGDNCEGCRHVNMVSYGPDFKNGAVLQEQYSMIDFAPTVAELMNINVKNCDGNVIYGLFE